VTFNAHHAPIGAYASLTLGTPGHSGFSLEAGVPPEQELLVGVRAPDDIYEALPLFRAQEGDPLRELAPVVRDFDATTDNWTADGVSLRILSPLSGVPEPGVASLLELKDALLPAVLVELTVDNLAGDDLRRAFFGVRATTGSDAGSPRGPTPRLTHVHAEEYGFALSDGEGRMAGAFSIAPGASSAAGTDVAAVLGGPPGGKGRIGALRFDVPAHRRVTFLIAIAFWHGGSVMRGSERDCSYWYTRLFDDIEDVAVYALDNFERLAGAHLAAARELDVAALSAQQAFQLAHAMRSYYGNTALLAAPDGRPLWAVVEGELMFVNPLDLVVDQLFFELRQSPWTVRNVIDAFLERHRFDDGAGIAFAHDMGVFPRFAEPGRSADERRTPRTTEELTNWTLSALVYAAQTCDEAWSQAHAGVLEQCLRSLIARAPDGLPDGEEDEITTYDSLDASLRQARGSSYLAGKQWAAYVCLAAFFAARGRREAAATAGRQARRVADRLVAAAREANYTPAVIATEGGPANLARVLPVVEGLAYALFGGAADALRRDGEYGGYLSALACHLRTSLVPGGCLLADGGWKLTSADDISWLSKIFLCQFVARRILRLDWDATGRRADAAPEAWLNDGELATWAWSDEILAGAIHGWRYYPRGVTAVLWLEEHAATARLTTQAPSPARITLAPRRTLR
jgi:hypothetical protein